MTFFSRARDAAKSLVDQTRAAGKAAQGHVDANKDQLKSKATEVLATATAATKAAARSAAETAQNLYWDARYPKTAIRDLQHNVEAQGGLYRELLKNKRTSDTIFIGGE